MSGFFVSISEAIQEGDQDKVAHLTEQGLAQDFSALEILEKGMTPGIEALGEKMRKGEIYLPEVLISARAMNRGIEILNPHFPRDGVHKRGTVVIGTVEGDMHDIGKNLVALMLGCGGFQVVDLGVDVPAQSFVDAARAHKADLVCISALLTTTMTNIPAVIEALKETDRRAEVKVMIGGAPITRSYADQIGAEGYAEDCTASIDEAKRLLNI